MTKTLICLSGLFCAIASSNSVRGEGTAPPASEHGGRLFLTPQEWDDPPYDRYVDVSLLGQAWADLDARLMADIGLQLSEGERVLCRCHKSLTSRSILSLAIKIAAEKGDRDTLKRLSTALEKRGPKQLTLQLASAQEQIPKHKSIIVDLDQFTPTQLSIYRACVDSIRAAKILKDGHVLETLSKGIPALVLPESSRSQLAEMAEDALESIPKRSARPTEEEGIKSAAIGAPELITLPTPFPPINLTPTLPSPPVLTTPPLKPPDLQTPVAVPAVGTSPSATYLTLQNPSDFTIDVTIRDIRGSYNDQILPSRQSTRLVEHYGSVWVSATGSNARGGRVTLGWQRVSLPISVANQTGYRTLYIQIHRVWGP